MRVNGEKVNPHLWQLKAGDAFKGQKIKRVEFIEDKSSGNHAKLITLQDGTQYLLDQERIQKV